jgi:hypothetical protein
MGATQVKVTLRLTVSQSVSLGVEPHLGLMTRYLLLFDSYGFVFVGRPLWWREDGSVFCICCWSLPVQFFSGLSPLRLATVFYCLWFETSLFVASYDSQGHGGGIRPRLHTDAIQSQSHIATDGQWASKSWCRGLSGAHDQIFITVWQLRSCFLARGRVCLLLNVGKFLLGYTAPHARRQCSHSHCSENPKPDLKVKFLLWLTN